MDKNARFGLLLALLVAPAAWPAKPLTVGVLADGPTARETITPEFILEEARNVMGGALELRFPQVKRLDGGWTQEGIRAGLDRLLADPQVDVVLTLGLVAS